MRQQGKVFLSGGDCVGGFKRSMIISEERWCARVQIYVSTGTLNDLITCNIDLTCVQFSVYLHYICLYLKFRVMIKFRAKLITFTSRKSVYISVGLKLSQMQMNFIERLIKIVNHCDRQNKYVLCLVESLHTLKFVVL